MKDDDERRYPPGIVPGAVGALGAIAFAVLVLGVACGWLLGSCDHREPVQMIPSPAAQATASAQVVTTATGRLKVTIPGKTAFDVAPQGQQTSDQGQSILSRRPSPEPSIRPSKTAFVKASNDADGGDIVIEFEQALSTAATSSAQASASSSLVKVTDSRPLDHGRLGVIAATMPGILAADVQIVRLDVSPVTRWLVDVPLEVGVDVAGNLEAGAVGASAGGKAFVGVYYWSRWNLSAQGVALGAGLRF